MAARALRSRGATRDRAKGPTDAGEEIGQVPAMSDRAAQEFVLRNGKTIGGAHDCGSDLFCLHGTGRHAAGAILVAAPQVQDFVIKPYFWVLIAVGLFDGGIYLLGRTAPGQMLTMKARSSAS